MIKELIKLSNHLDSKGLVKESDYLDGIIKRSSLTAEQKAKRQQLKLKRMELLKTIGGGLSEAIVSLKKLEKIDTGPEDKEPMRTLYLSREAIQKELNDLNSSYKEIVNA